MKPIIIIAFFVLLVYLGIHFSKKYNNDFLQNSVEVTGKITNVTFGNSLVDLHGDDNILNHIIEYSFEVNGKPIKSFYEVEKEDYNLYFNHEVSIGESISILYHKNDPSVNRIKKLE